MNSVFKDHLPYRSHKGTKQHPQQQDSSSSPDNYYYEIRPHFHFLDTRKGSIHHQLLDAGSVTGVPQLVELDDSVFNPLDPGQLLKESAAAACRAALQVIW